MRVYVLWEDGRGNVAKGFGPHELLLACIADDLGLAREHLKQRLESYPQKGNGSLLKTLQHKLQRLRKTGPVIAVVDRDQLHDLWRPPKPPPPTCTSGMVARFRQDADGDYDLVLLDRNMESLIEVVCHALGRDPPRTKPTPGQRDQLLMRAAWMPRMSDVPSGIPVRASIES